MRKIAAILSAFTLLLSMEACNSGPPEQELTSSTEADATMAKGLAINYSGGSGMPDDVAAWLDANGIERQ